MSKKMLQEAGLRCTQRREIILQVLSRAQTPLTADEVHAEAIKLERMGLSTAYRVLAQLTEAGLLLKNEGGDGRSYYQIASAPSHMHTLHCTVCGDVVPIEGCPLAELEEHLCAETGYTITGHSLTFTGVCPRCQQTGYGTTVHPHDCDCHAHEKKKP